MIHIITKTEDEITDIVAVYDLPSDSKQRYNEFIANSALQMGIVININWHNIMNHEIYHSELTAEEYMIKKNIWNDFLKKNTFLKYCGRNFPKKKLKFRTENI